MMSNKQNNEASIHLAIRPSRLEALIREGQVTITDFYCLDAASKKGVWQMLRMLAVKRLL